MLGDAIGRGEEIDEVLGDVEGFDGADAEALDGSFVKDAAEEIFEFDAGGKIAAVSAEVDTAEDDFAIARFGEALDFLDNCVGGQAAASPANKRDDAVGTPGIAAVLDLERGAGVVSFSPEHRRAKQHLLLEYISGEDLAKVGRNIPSAALGIKMRPYKGMERNGRVRVQGRGGEKVVWRFRGRGAGKRIDQLGDLRLVGIADDPRDAGKCSQFFGGALGITAGGDKADGGVGGMELSNGVAGLGIGGGGDSAGVDHHNVRGSGRGSGGATTVKQLALDGGAISLGGAATEL